MKSLLTIPVSLLLLSSPVFAYPEIQQDSSSYPGGNSSYDNGRYEGMNSWGPGSSGGGVLRDQENLGAYYDCDTNGECTKRY